MFANVHTNSDAPAGPRASTPCIFVFPCSCKSWRKCGSGTTHTFAKLYPAVTIACAMCVHCCEYGLRQPWMATTAIFWSLSSCAPVCSCIAYTLRHQPLLHQRRMIRTCHLVCLQSIEKPHSTLSSTISAKFLQMLQAACSHLDSCQ